MAHAGTPGLQTRMQALAGFLPGICRPPGGFVLMRAPCNHPCETQGGELLLINARSFQGACNRGSAGIISLGWAAACHGVAEVCAHTCACTHACARSSSRLVSDATPNTPPPPCPGFSAGPLSPLRQPAEQE